MSRWQCKSCSWEGTDKDLLKAPSPFNPDDELTACPDCQAVEDFDEMCEIDGCDNYASCGWPSYSRRYVRSCGKHMREAEAAGDVAPSGWVGGPK